MSGSHSRHVPHLLRRGHRAIALLSLLTVSVMACAGGQVAPPSSPAPTAASPAAKPTAAATSPAAVVTAAPAGSPAAKPTVAAAATPAGPAQALKIGVNFELSGAYATSGAAFVQGFQMAAKDINDAGGFTVAGKRYTVDLVIQDTRMDPSVAAANATGMIRDNGIKLILGPISWGPAHQIVIQSGGLTASAGPPSDLLINHLSENPTVFSTLFNNEYFYPVGWAALRQNFLPKDVTRLVLIGDDSVSTGITTFPAVTKAAEAAGFQVVDRVTYPVQGGTDWNVLMTKVKALNPDIVFYASGIQTGPMLKAGEELNATKYYSAIAQDPAVINQTALGKPPTHPFYTITGAPQYGGDLPMSPQKAAFSTKTEAFLGKPFAVTFSAYIAADYYFLTMLTQALVKAGTVDDVPAIAKALEGQSFDGPLGTGQIIGHYVVFPTEVTEYKDGKMQLCDYADPKDLSKKQCTTK